MSAAANLREAADFADRVTVIGIFNDAEISVQELRSFFLYFIDKVLMTIRSVSPRAKSS